MTANCLSMGCRIRLHECENERCSLFALQHLRGNTLATDCRLRLFDYLVTTKMPTRVSSVRLCLSLLEILKARQAPFGLHMHVYNFLELLASSDYCCCKLLS